jgi:hypothetical protein
LQSWKPIFIVLRPRILSIYRDQKETKLRHQITLSELTAVARQKDPKRPEKSIFGLYSPARNYHFDAQSDKEAQEWVEFIRKEAKIDEHEEEMVLASPGGAHISPYQGFGRSIDAQISPSGEERTAMSYASSSDAEALSPSAALPKTRGREPKLPEATRQPSYAEYSGADRGSYSDLSDIGGPASRLSALSLAATDPRPSTSSMNPPQLHTIYGSAPVRPSAGGRNASQMSGLGLREADIRRAQNPHEEERVVYQAWTYLLKSKSGVRQWKKVWLVVRPKALAVYKNEDEYAAILIVPFDHMIDAVEIDPISRSKANCMQILTEERNYRFCAFDEESLTRCLGALKSLLAKRRARRKEKEKEGASGSPVAVNA